jgi:hypothetical protein
MEEIHCKAQTPPETSDSLYGIDKANCKLYIPAGTLDAYKNASGWGEFTNIIEE